MIDIPFKTQVRTKLYSITDFRIVFFQDRKESFHSPHWYIIIPTPNAKFLKIIITSQIEKRIDYYREVSQKKAIECLVKINNNEFSFLSKESAINCNETEFLSAEEIAHRVDEEKGFQIDDYSGPNRPLIPFQIGHPIRSKSAGHSGANQATHLMS